MHTREEESLELQVVDDRVEEGNVLSFDVVPMSSPPGEHAAWSGITAATTASGSKGAEFLREEDLPSRDTPRVVLERDGETVSMNELVEPQTTLLTVLVDHLSYEVCDVTRLQCVCVCVCVCVCGFVCAMCNVVWCCVCACACAWVCIGMYLAW
jgi:hypothetical protein